MAYTKHTWASGPSGNTPITHTKLNEMEDGIYNAHTGYSTAQSLASAANSRSTTNATNIASLTNRVSTAENSLDTLSGDTQYLNSRVDTLNTTVSSNSGTISSHTSSIATINSSLTNLSSAVEGQGSRIDALEEGGGGSASLTVSQYVNPVDITITNNAWAVSPRLVNRPGASNSGDIVVTDQTTNGRGVLQVLRTGIYLMSMTVVDTQNPTGQANFLCNTVKVTDANASSVSQVLARFQHYASNQGSGTAAMQLNAGDYVSYQFRQNATGGSMVLPNGVAAIENNTYVGLALTFIKVG